MFFEKGVIIVGGPSVLKILHHIPALFIITNSDCCCCVRVVCQKETHIGTKQPIQRKVIQSEN